MAAETYVGFVAVVTYMTFEALCTPVPKTITNWVKQLTNEPAKV